MRKVCPVGAVSNMIWSSEVRDHYYETYDETFSQFALELNISRLMLMSTLKTFLPVLFFLLISLISLLLSLDKLESRGLVARERSVNDARMQHVRLTPRGTALVERSVLALLDGERVALDGLSAAERAMLVELLHKVALSRRKPERAS